MKVAYNPQVSYTARTEERKDAEKKVVTGGGALAATTTAANLKGAKSGVDLFTSTSKISQGMKATTNAAKAAGEVAQKSKGLWAKVVENAKWGKDWVLHGASKFKDMKYIRPLVNNRLFRCCAGGLGYAFGAVTLISGLSDIGKAALDTAEKYSS